MSPRGIHVGDSAIPWNKRTAFIPWTSFMSIGNTALDGATQAIWITEASGTTAGTPLVGEIGATSTDVAGIEVAAAGDLISTFWPYPSEMDMSDPDLWFRVHFVHETTDTDTPDFKVHYLHRAKQEGFLEPVAGATAVTSILDHAVAAVADSLEVTDWTIAATQPASTDVGSLLALEADHLGSAGAGEMFILGLEMQYNVDMMVDRGPGD